MKECVGIHSDNRLWYSASLSLYTMKPLSVLGRQREQKRRHKITVQKKDATVLKCKVAEKVRMSDGEVLLFKEKE